jgi:hypothetical protein
MSLWEKWSFSKGWSRLGTETGTAVEQPSPHKSNNTDRQPTSSSQWGTPRTDPPTTPPEYILAGT